MLLLASLFLESSSILGRNDERLNHLGGIVIAVELVQLIARLNSLLDKF